MFRVVFDLLLLFVILSISFDPLFMTRRDMNTAAKVQGGHALSRFGGAMEEGPPKELLQTGADRRRLQR